MLTLASSSRTRQALLSNAAIPHEVVPARIDEVAIRDSLVAEGHTPRNVADALAEMKALRVSRPGFILGCDQILAFDGAIISKPESPDQAVAHLTAMAGQRHRLHSASVLVEDGKPIWRHVGDVTMLMRPSSDSYIQDYVSRNWETIRHSAGSYTLEGEGARLFHQVQGDYFSVLGLPLLPLIGFLNTRGVLPS